MQFRLATLFWVMLVFATSMGLAGGWGIPLAIYWIALSWFAARPAGKRALKEALPGTLLATAFAGMLVGLPLSLTSVARKAEKQTRCVNNLKQVGLGLHCYRDEFKRLPPPVVYDASGKPMHSWRTLLLRYLCCGSVYGEYDLTQAWNEGKNTTAIRMQVLTYLCPYDKSSAPPASLDTTSYLAIVGPGTVWDSASKPPPLPPEPGDKGSAPADTRIMAVEVAHSGIPWAEPKDLALDDVLRAIEDESPTIDMPHSGHPEGRGGGLPVLRADGSVRWLPRRLPRRLLETLVKEGFTADAEAELERIQDRISREFSLDRVKEYSLVAVTFAVWLASAIGFGVHAFRVRRSQQAPATEATTAATAPLSDGPPSQDAGK